MVLGPPMNGDRRMRLVELAGPVLDVGAVIGEPRLEAEARRAEDAVRPAVAEARHTDVAVALLLRLQLAHGVLELRAADKI